MKNMLILLTFFALLSVPKAHAEPNMVLCWIFSMQGCPGVEPESGNAINMSNNGSGGIGAIGGMTSRVETRTIITIPDYKIRRFLRALGLGGQRININYELDESECNRTGDSLRPTTNALFAANSARECMRALEQDLNRLPYGIHLQVTQCQERFCHEDFIEVFEAFLKDNPTYNVTDTNSFLGCGPRTVEI